jgi:hypothetical protein
MTPKQRQAVIRLLLELAEGTRMPYGIFHHGDCLGSDVEAAGSAKQTGYFVIGHPGRNEVWRAWFASDETRIPDDNLARNRAIVREADVLIACPRGATEQLRSGTWATVRYARRIGVRVMLIAPDGSTSEL